MARWLIERAGIQITVKAKSSAAKELVAAALAGMHTQRIKKTRGVKLTVDHDNDGWHLLDHSNDLKRKLKMPGDLIYHLTDRIVFHIADKSEKAHCLHAASVSHGQRAIVIPANSGAGKSSFTTWLVANGFSYLTDELILINPEHRITGVGRPIQIKSHGLEAVKHLFVDPELVFPGNLANAVTVEALGGEVSQDQCHDLAVMIFPQYHKDADYELVKLTSAEAGMSLMANHVNARNLEGHGFREMMTIIRATPCYKLEYGGFDKLPGDFAEQLKELVAE